MFCEMVNTGSQTMIGSVESILASFFNFNECFAFFYHLLRTTLGTASNQKEYILPLVPLMSESWNRQELCLNNNREQL